MADYTITLENMALQMRLGIHPHEAVPQRVLLSVWLTISYAGAPADRIDAVLDYDAIRRGVVALASGEGFGLQETLVEAVAALCLADPRVRAVKVRSVKPDVYPDATVGCEIVRERAR